ncbi:hypothetical protein E3N88_09201 [Mikania micrantha]|uniref:Uncharacterized protein n=1 Tax=Mikania micrantha TaxID=192012 RepID=A0A5N6PLG8_9ASTR|nr:hypothetical protein E3N88_09201 [Mikania micrantha]
MMFYSRETGKNGPGQQNKLIGLEIQARRFGVKIEGEKQERTHQSHHLLPCPCQNPRTIGSQELLKHHLRGSRGLEAVILDTSHPRGHLPQVGIWGMADSNSNANRSAARPTGTDDLAAESRRRIDDIVAQVDAEMDRRARDAARARHWGWLPTIIQGWIIGERVPPYRFPGDTTPGHRLPSLGVPLEQAFAAHVAYTRREIGRTRELSDEVRVLREKNDRLERQNERLEGRNDRLEA